MKKIILVFTIFLIFSGVIFFGLVFGLKEQNYVYYNEPKIGFWPFRSVDTMKYSRDLSREMLYNFNFDAKIDNQMKNIAAIGATHVAIATPYDEEFLPMLRRWVKAARKYNLKIWFRGNWSGWEGWFDYPKITRDDHIKKTKEFILANSDIFQDGDIFSGCPECENGGPGDPRSTGDADGYRNFIIKEYQATGEAFALIKKDVASNYFPMNADVANLIMDKKTTKALGGVVVLDHYAKTADSFTQYIKNIEEKSGGRIILGEFGAPIPDINGEMTETEQADWLREVLNKLARLNFVDGLNYWVNVGGSTQIWNSRGVALPAAGVLGEFYKPNIAYGVIRDDLARPVANAQIIHPNGIVFSDKDGYFELNFTSVQNPILKISASGFLAQEIPLRESSGQLNITLKREKKDIIFKLLEAFQKIRHYLLS